MKGRYVLFMKMLLNVPYPQKDLAKSKGAKWNPNIKSWYIDDVTKVDSVKQWLPPFNIICENLYLLKMQHFCWKCGKQMDVVMLATDKSYSDENGEKYQQNVNLQLLTYVKSMPGALAKYLTQYLYRPSLSKTICEDYFVNHCPYCGRITGDNYLHEIPQQAFYKKIFYKDSDPITYAKIACTFAVPILASLPYYDDISRDLDLTLHHMFTGKENRASLMVNQKEVNKLFECSIKDNDITISGLW